MNLTDQLLRPLLPTSARPLITHYDEAAGSRVELSTATLANWAAKTANWLVEEYDVEPGDQVAVHLPAHWQTAGILLGAWWCGAHITDDDAAARIAFLGPDGVGSKAEATAVVALDPLGRGLKEVPSGTVDYLSDVRLASDNFSPLFPIPGDTPALLSLDANETIAAARASAKAADISTKDRVLSTVEWTLPDGLIRGFLATVAAGAHLVQITHADSASLDNRRRTERTTIDLLK